MRLGIDTNVVLSAVVFPSGAAAAFLRFALEYHTIVISTYVLEELYAVFERKFPHKRDALDRFIVEVAFEHFTCKQPLVREQDLSASIRDPKDVPVYAFASDAGCDYLVTGDKDLTSASDLHSPPVISPRAFLDLFAQEGMS